MKQRKNQARVYSMLAMLKSPCPKCQQVWATVKGTARKRLSVKCSTRGHLLVGHASRTHVPYRELVQSRKTTHIFNGGIP